MMEFWTIFCAVIAADATLEVIKYIGKLVLRPRVRRDARGRFAIQRSR